MEKSIETIWKEGFLDSEALVVPKINNLYNQKSMYLIDKLKRMFRINTIALVVMAIAFVVIYYFIDALWQGIGAALLLLGFAWYNSHQIRQFDVLDQGMSSYDYLKSFDRCLKDILSKNVLITRFYYPLCLFLALSTVWFAGDNQVMLTQKLKEKFPDMIFVGGVPLVGLIAVGIIMLLAAYFADKIYKWDVRLIYGRIFDKLEETIAEMEELKS